MADPNPYVAGTLSRCLLLAATVSAVDFVSKEIASRWRIETLVFNTNTRVTIGVDIGLPVWIGDAMIAACTIVLALSVVRALAALDDRAITALGLITGGTMGNLASLLAGPDGVADFLDVPLAPDYVVIANGADLALWGGTLLLVPVVHTLVTTLRYQKPI